MKEIVDAKNDLEHFAYSLKNQISEKGQLNEKLSDEDKSTIQEAVDSTISWIESNPTAELDDLKEKKSELEKIVQPITSKLYQGNSNSNSNDREEL